MTRTVNNGMTIQTAPNVRTNNLGRSLTIWSDSGPSRSAAANTVAKVAAPESSINQSYRESTLSFRCLFPEVDLLNYTTNAVWFALSNQKSRSNGCHSGK